ncbi:M56 family metallopeptidase [Sphingobacterium lactis]|uniref:M56 family metallopeptidase n=1 Tax=Sphingobacterium lactis TaxID=797291 RepID=UPI003DA52072
MEAILTYLIQVNLLLALLFLGYQGLLKGLTFYRLNRLYLLLGSMYAFLYPFLDIKSWFADKLELPQGIFYSYLPAVEVQEATQFSFVDLLTYIALLGASVFFTKLFVQVLSLLRIHWHSKPAHWRQYLFRNVVFPITPFSFFNKIYLHQEQHHDLELNDIFKHEYVHVKGLHSIDVLWFEMVLITCWYNPFVWLMRKSVRQNLEFLTDQQVLDKGVDRQAYQYSLLHVTKQGARVDISNQFNFKTLKKRIMMMNKKRSSKVELGKYAFLLPILIITGISFSVNRAEAQIEKVVIQLQDADVVEQMDRVMTIKLPDTTKQEINRVHIARDMETPDSIIVNLKESTDEVIVREKGNMEQGTNTEFRTKVERITVDLRRPVIIYNGEKLSKEASIVNVPLEELSSVEIVKGAEAVQKYGQEAKYGALVVRGKLPAERFMPRTLQVGVEFKSKSVKNIPGLTISGQQTDTVITVHGFQSKPQRLHNGEGMKFEAKPQDLTEITVQGYKRPDKTEDNSSAAESIPHRIRILGHSLNSGNARDALYFIDGKESSFKETQKINAAEIDSFETISPTSATSLYGQKGKHGAIIITTKNAKRK